MLVISVWALLESLGCSKARRQATAAAGCLVKEQVHDAGRRQSLPVTDLHHVLLDDGPRLQIGRDVMRRRADDLHAAPYTITTFSGAGAGDLLRA